MKREHPSSHCPKRMDRRSFLRLSGLLGLGVASAGVLPAAAEAVKFNRKTYKVSKTRLAMGTFVSMTLVHSSRDQAEQAMGLAFEEIDRLNRTLSRFDGATAVAHLNNEGFLADIPPEVATCMKRSLDFYRVSRGNFDITVKPLVDLFKASFTAGGSVPPSEKQLEEAVRLVGSDKIALDGRSIRFKEPGMGITLDGIAKGFIVDRASNVLTEQGIENHLINAGGDIRTMGVRQDKKPWGIAIQDPQKKRNYPDVIHMNEGAIATSGNYEVFYDREKMFHHIVDPTTGLSPAWNTSVSVVARTAMDADALSTAVFVMEPERSMRFIDSLSRCECLVIPKEGEMLTSSGWKRPAI
ncbi:MAG: FAD:protein FMN transferase [Deltaproteobacteria bacterium]|nr:FAD:protein FMN transferase [Deltaproteobacteria bacterium]MBW2284828.1 FAD:protein FMN transferase [Deltaproteobacteria bacterium]